MLEVGIQERVNLSFSRGFKSLSHLQAAADMERLIFHGDTAPDPHLCGSPLLVARRHRRARQPHRHRLVAPSAPQGNPRHLCSSRAGCGGGGKVPSHRTGVHR